GQGRLAGRRRGPVRNQRSLRRGGDGADPRTGHPAREGQRQRRRLRAGPSDRRLRRAAGGYAGKRLAHARPQAWHCLPLHRRRRSDGHRHRIDLIGLNVVFTKMNAMLLDTRNLLAIMFPARNGALAKFHDEDSQMSINKLLIAMTLGLALAACSKQEAAQDAAAAANEAATDAQVAADQAAAETADAAQAA